MEYSPGELADPPELVYESPRSGSRSPSPFDDEHANLRGSMSFDSESGDDIDLDDIDSGSDEDSDLWNLQETFADPNYSGDPFIDQDLLQQLAYEYEFGSNPDHSHHAHDVDWDAESGNDGSSSRSSSPPHFASGYSLDQDPDNNEHNGDDDDDEWPQQDFIITRHEFADAARREPRNRNLGGVSARGEPVVDGAVATGMSRSPTREEGGRDSRPDGVAPSRRLRQPVIEIQELFDDLVEVEPAMDLRRPPRRSQTAGGPAERSARTVSVIDLTEEPDSPDGPQNAPSHRRARLQLPPFSTVAPPSNILQRNPRRQMSLNNGTPSLTRSDGSALGNGIVPAADVIDLTMDDDAPPARNPEQNRNPRSAPLPLPRLPPPSQLAPHAYVLPITVSARPNEMDHGSHIGYFELLRSVPARMDILNRVGTTLFGRPPANAEVDFEILDMRTSAAAAPVRDPLGGNLPDLNYRANGYNGGRSNKPVHEAPPKAREGFSRSTGEEQVFICPGCEEELAYDPEESSPAAKKARTRKDREEHYFWAVKDCGHVYCKKCFDGRKPTKTRKSPFGQDPNNPRKVICAVEDCQTDVATKGAWVGIFL